MCVCEGGKVEANMNWTFAAAWGGSFLLVMFAIFVFKYWLPLGNFGDAWSAMMQDIAETTKKLMGFGIGPGMSVLGLQVLEPKRKRGFLSGLQGIKPGDDLFDAEYKVDNGMGGVSEIVRGKTSLSGARREGEVGQMMGVVESAAGKRAAKTVKVFSDIDAGIRRIMGQK